MKYLWTAIACAVVAVTLAVAFWSILGTGGLREPHRTVAAWMFWFVLGFAAAQVWLEWNEL